MSSRVADRYVVEGGLSDRTTLLAGDARTIGYRATFRAFARKAIRWGWFEEVIGSLPLSDGGEPGEGGLKLVGRGRAGTGNRSSSVNRVQS